MKKIFLALFILSYTFASIINGIAIVVNSEPITMLDIIKTSKMLNISKKEATELLIDQKLQESQIKKFGIFVDEFELEDAIENFAKERGLTLSKLKDIIEKQGISWQEYKEKFKKDLLKRKLYQKIVSSKLSQPDTKELLEYYKNNIDKFSIPKYVEVVKYISKDRVALNKIKSNPMAAVDGVQVDQEMVDISKINPKLALLLKDTKENSFTPIIPLEDSFLLIYIKKKIDVTPMEFENVKDAVLAKMVEEKREKIIKEFIAKLKINANIEVIRLP